MITIASTATAVPPNVLSLELVKEYFGRTFSLSSRRLSAMLEVLDNSRIERRYSLFPVDYLVETRSLTQKNSEYREARHRISARGRGESASTRKSQSRRRRHDHHRLVHGVHDSVGGCVLDPGNGISFRCAAFADH